MLRAAFLPRSGHPPSSLRPSSTRRRCSEAGGWDEEKGTRETPRVFQNRTAQQQLGRTTRTRSSAAQGMFVSFGWQERTVSRTQERQAPVLSSPVPGSFCFCYCGFVQRGAGRGGAGRGGAIRTSSSLTGLGRAAKSQQHTGVYDSGGENFDGEGWGQFHRRANKARLQ